MIRRHPWGDLADPNLPPPSDVAILGLPFEGGACWRGGAAEAPRRLREISDSSPAISEEGYIVEPSILKVKDLGDIVPVARAARSLAMLEALVGQLYPAIILARLVSLHGERA